MPEHWKAAGVSWDPCSVYFSPSGGPILLSWPCPSLSMMMPKQVAARSSRHSLLSPCWFSPDLCSFHQHKTTSCPLNPGRDKETTDCSAILYISDRMRLSSLCPLAIFVHLRSQNCTCGKQRKSLTHSFYQDCYLYKVCMLHKLGREQYMLETGVQSFTQSLSYCHTTESPQKWPVFSSFPLPFTAEPPSAQLASCRMLMWSQCMKRELALHTQDSSIVRT